ncbi:O-antigen ligase family protein [Haloimpatiens lingqiaonensis]|uniref:O-antigen ligase family protein n=2 Tax=Haloimpatiens lingqiaonensis TaxID=1380675 RepID=UPI0037BFCCC8
MKQYVNEVFHSNRNIIFISILLSCILAILNINGSSKKDVVTLFFATFLLINDMYLAIKDSKKSILLFLVSLPILVTARKFLQIDFFVFKISFESIYVTFLFVLNIKRVIFNIKHVFRCGSRNTFNFYILILTFIIFVYNANTYSVYFFKSMADTYIGVIVPIMFMLVSVSIFNKNDIKKIILSLIFSVDLSCLYGFIQIFKDGISISNINKNRAFLTFGYHNVNIFAGILVTVIPFTLEYILYKKNNKSEKIFLYSSFIIEMFALLVTFTRGAWLTAIIAVFLILISKKYKKFLIAMVVLGAILFKPTMSFILTRGNTLISFFQNESAIARIQSIYTDIRIIKDYPFGVGMSSFPEFYKEFAVRGYLMMPEEFRWKITAAHYMLEHAHNLILQIGVEFGIVALAIFILIIINRIKATISKYEENRMFFVSFIVYIVFSTLTGNEFNHKGVITGTLIIFLIMALIQVNNFEACHKA